jgi:hypothetical protein
VPKAGLIVQPRPKTAAGWRVVAVPDFAVEMIRSRQVHPAGGVVFTGPLARTLRDPSNASGDLRQLLDSFDCELCAGTLFQLEPDGSRKTGTHTNPSMTLDVYFGRQVVSAAAAEVFDR